MLKGRGLGRRLFQDVFWHKIKIVFGVHAYLGSLSSAGKRPTAVMTRKAGDDSAGLYNCPESRFHKGGQLG